MNLIQRNNKGVVVVVNKWDLIEKDHKSTDVFIAGVIDKFAPFQDFPIVFTSALTKQRIHKTLELAIKVYENRKRQILTSVLNEFLHEAIEAYRPPAIKGKFIRIMPKQENY
jgi:GTP-binding protein